MEARNQCIGSFIVIYLVSNFVPPRGYKSMILLKDRDGWEGDVDEWLDLRELMVFDFDRMVCRGIISILSGCE
jgi:hypothetical protein